MQGWEILETLLLVKEGCCRNGDCWWRRWRMWRRINRHRHTECCLRGICLGWRWLEDGIGQFLQLLLDLADIRDKLKTMLAVCSGRSLVGLSSGLGAREVFGCKESVDFIF